MIYLIDPVEATSGGINPCILKCVGVCGIKPCYGVTPPVPI